MILYKKALEKEIDYLHELIQHTEDQKQVEADLNVTEEQVADGVINQGEYMEAMAEIGQQWQMYKRLIERTQHSLDKNKDKIDLAVRVAQRRGIRKPSWETRLVRQISDKREAYEWLIAS